MTFSIHGLAVARGIAIGRAVLVASSRVDVAHYFITAADVESEIDRVRVARNAVVDEIVRLQHTLDDMGPKEAPHELKALLDVHLMLLQDESLTSGVKHWITDRLYNAEWALTTQLEVIARQFDEMEDQYLRERKADLEQVCERILRQMKGAALPIIAPHVARRKTQQDLLLDDTMDGFKQRQADLERGRLHRLLNTPAITLDGQKVELLANIEMPEDAVGALAAGAVGVGLFRSEFLFMGRLGNLPDEEEQYQAYKRAVQGMQGLPVTIRTVDIGADKPLDKSSKEGSSLNPALGLRAIRWSLADPAMFLNQLRAILRAAAHGQVHLLIPMLAHAREIRQTVALIEEARHQLDAKGQVYGPVQLGAMIEVPAAALSLKLFLKYFDFLSVGTNDLIQYTLAIDRADEAVAHLYDPLHPAVLRLLSDTITECHAQGKGVSVCGEMAGDVSLTRLLLGMGLRSFSMHPAQILAVKQEILRADAGKLKGWAQHVLDSEEPALELSP